MSQNIHLDAAWQYHSGTKHSQLSVRMNPHFLDWDNKPLLFKIYPTLEVMRLPRDFRETRRAALDAIAIPGGQASVEAVPDVETLAQLLFFSAGVVRSKRHEQGETFFRAAACTGALYEIELYIVCTDLQGETQPGANFPSLAAGVYHFGVAEFGLRQLRAGDFRQTWWKPRAATRPLRTRPSSSSAPGRTGAMPGNIARAPIAILAGITAPFWPISWRSLRLRIFRPGL